MISLEDFAVCRRKWARCNLHATLAAVLALAALSGCDEKPDENKRPVGGGTTTVFGSAPLEPTPPDASAAVDAGEDGGANAPCASDAGPGCPMLRFMKGDVALAFAGKKSADLLAALDTLQKNAPAGYANWSSISKDGAAAVKAGDWTAAKAACRGCHNQYKDKYVAEHRSDALVHGK